MRQWKQISDDQWDYQEVKSYGTLLLAWITRHWDYKSQRYFFKARMEDTVSAQKGGELKARIIGTYENIERAKECVEAEFQEPTIAEIAKGLKEGQSILIPISEIEKIQRTNRRDRKSGPPSTNPGDHIS